MSRIYFSVNLSPFNTTVSKKVISFSDISAVNFIVGWNALACSMKRSTSFFFFAVPKGENVVNVTFPLSWLGIDLLN